MLAKWLSIRQGPVKVAQRHRSERYPENPRPKADHQLPRSIIYAQYIQNNAYYICFIWTYRGCLSIWPSIYQAFSAKYNDDFRPSLWFLVPPPFSSTSPNKPLQPVPAIDWNPRRFRDICVTLVTTMVKMPQRKASYHQFQRFVLHLRFHVDDPPRNSLWKWKPSPASAARKCGDVIHFTSTHSPGRAMSQGGWGDGNDHAMNKRSDWMDFVKEGAASDLCILLIGGACYQGSQRFLPQTKRQLEEGAVAILKGALTPHQSTAYPLCEMLCMTSMI